MKAKKFYVEPHFEVVKIATTQILCDSPYTPPGGATTPIDDDPENV